MKIDRLLQNTFAQTHDFRPFFMNVYEIHAESRYRLRIWQSTAMVTIRRT